MDPSIPDDRVTVRVHAHRHDGLELHNVLAQPAIGPTRGGVVLLPSAYGCTGELRRRAHAVAALGYAALAADLFGQGRVATGREEAMALIAPLRAAPRLAMARAQAAIDAFASATRVPIDRTVAAGFCFGGSVALDLARSGADLRGAVSFHGGLKTSLTSTTGGIRASILVLHGGADPGIPPSDVAQFMGEMLAAGARWRLEVYGTAVHSFTEPSANAPGRAAYDAEADRRSHRSFAEFLAELLP